MLSSTIDCALRLHVSLCSPAVPAVPASRAVQRASSSSKASSSSAGILRSVARHASPHRSSSTRVAAQGRTAAISKAEALDPHARDSFGQTPLIRAAKAGNVVTIQQLLDQGADVNAQDNWGTTALMLASAKGHAAAAAKLLLQHGATVDMRDSQGRTALMAVATWGTYTTMVNVAILAFPSVSSPSGAYECAEALVAAGADVNARDDMGLTPLARLAQTIFDEHAAATARLLLAAGADGCPALEAAVHFENSIALEVLISAGVDASDLLAKKLEFTHRSGLSADEALLLLRAGASIERLPLQLKQLAVELAMADFAERRESTKADSVS